MLPDGSKTMMQIAESCGVRYNEVQRTVKKSGIIGKLRVENNRKYLTVYQQDLIYEILYFEGKTNEIVLESKINFNNEL